MLFRCRENAERSSIMRFRERMTGYIEISPEREYEKALHSLYPHLIPNDSGYTADRRCA